MIVEVKPQSLGTIGGTVADLKTGEALPGANVVIMGTQIGASTEAGGKYTLSVPKGDYVLQVSYVSYKTVRTSVKVEAGKRIIKDFKLDADLIGTDEVVVLGSRRTDRTVTDSPVPIDVISA